MGMKIPRPIGSHVQQVDLDAGRLVDWREKRKALEGWPRLKTRKLE